MARIIKKQTRKQPTVPKELPVEVRQPDKAAKRLALLTILGIVVILGVFGAVLELFIAPLFTTADDVQLIQVSHAHAPLTSELDFLIQMVPHHQEAVDTAQLIASSTTDSKLKLFAEEIVTAQRVEIVQMNAWIDAWYPGQRYPHSYEPMMPALERLDGAARDRAFLLSMIEHHQAAVSMAQEVRSFNPRPEVAALADLIIRTQSVEIMEMQTTLGLPMDPVMHAANH